MSNVSVASQRVLLHSTRWPEGESKVMLVMIMDDDGGDGIDHGGDDVDDVGDDHGSNPLGRR